MAPTVLCVTSCAQIKRTAPVTGQMRRGDFDVVEFARVIEEAGVAAIAVNTDRKFFGCTYEDLTTIRVRREGYPFFC